MEVKIKLKNLVSYSKIDDPEKWGIEGFTCVSPEDAKKAEEFFNSLQYEIDKLKEENRILREGLDLICEASHMDFSDPSIGMAEFAKETLAKADKVGKGDM